MTLQSTYRSLLASRDVYYAEHRFPDVFAHLERAPESVAARLQTLPGIAEVRTRLVEPVMVPLPGAAEPASGSAVSLPTDEGPRLGGILLRSGRRPDESHADEAVVLESFAEAHGLRLGDPLPVVLNGRLRTLRVVGTAMSPEHVFVVPAGAMNADPKRAWSSSG